MSERSPLQLFHLLQIHKVLSKECLEVPGSSGAAVCMPSGQHQQRPSQSHRHMAKAKAPIHGQVISVRNSQRVGESNSGTALIFALPQIE